MRIRSLPISLFICFLLLPLFVYGKSPSEEASGNSGNESKEYREKSTKLLGLESRIVELNVQLSQMVELKKRERDPDKVRSLMKDLVSTTKERNKMANEHRELKSYLLYRFPNLGEAIHKKYGTHEGVTLEELEKAHGLSQLLDETQALIRKKYAPVLGESKESDLEVPKPAEKEQPLRLVK